MNRIMKRMGRWLGLIERRWWDDIDCTPGRYRRYCTRVGAEEKERWRMNHPDYDFVFMAVGFVSGVVITLVIQRVWL